MENRELLRVFLSCVMQCDPDQIGLWHGTNSPGQVINEISTGNFLYNFIIGFDVPDQCWLPVDHWLSQHNHTHKVFLLDEYYLNIEKNRRILKKIKTIPFNHDLLSNLASMRDLGNLYSFSCEFHSTNWLLLSRAQRPHRQYFINHWVNLLQHNLIYSNGAERAIGKFDIYNHVASYICNSKNLLDLTNTYNATCGSIVAETDMQNFLTEKTFHAFMALHPILMIGPRLAVEHLRNSGFDMFDDILNHSYDKLDSWQQRIDCMVNNNREILNTGINRSQIKHRLLQNQQLVWNYYTQSVNLAQQELIIAKKEMENQNV